MIVGLSVAAVQGALAVTQDNGLWFKDLSDLRLMEALKEAGGVVPQIETREESD